jgi:1-acyl-sn-glycerol-3-phosphate acyltransferase
MIVIYALWSIIGWILGFFWMTVCLIGCVLLNLFYPYKVWFYFIRFSLVNALTWSTLHRPKVTLAPGFEKKRLAIFTFNHVSILDAHISVTSIPHPYCGMENAAHFRIPIYGWLMRMSHNIPVYTHSQGRYDDVLREVGKRKEMGISILAFPEGHRTENGKVQYFRRGPFFLARDTGYDIVPVGVRGLHKVLPKGTPIIRPGKTEVYLGNHIDPSGLSDDEIGELAQSVQTRIAHYVEGRSDMI